ncbi:CsbD family protein [Streptomyces telluris]|uniref:CsbD family protein n=1 Tax=Streptomyces telluris TaxID=2720021 RepID=A0A9X2LK72_9ACTN|nr:CsbD family protein [Streptomyces telluris]MCQ8772479.1 CsbD family protein [Streptomyces telluris]NJP79512.1 CsbD family protein [Streptomyces telluris]
MGKGKAKAKQVKGKLKETTGNVTGDRRLEAEGRAEKVSGKVEESAERARKNLRDR